MGVECRDESRNLEGGDQNFGNSGFLLSMAQRASAAMTIFVFLCCFWEKEGHRLSFHPVSNLLHLQFCNVNMSVFPPFLLLGGGEKGSGGLK